MTPQTCKKLLEMGILQAYAEGKEVQTKSCDTWASYGQYNFDSPPENYRIKPEPQFEVGDLVRIPSGCICKVIQVHPDACEIQSITEGYYNIVHNSNLTKVHEVRTPFTFEEAVKACAKHGMEVKCRDNRGIINAIDYNSIRVGSEYLYFSNSCLQTVFTSDNTPFCNISYEPTPTN